MAGTLVREEVSRTVLELKFEFENEIEFGEKRTQAPGRALMDPVTLVRRAAHKDSICFLGSVWAWGSPIDGLDSDAGRQAGRIHQW